MPDRLGVTRTISASPELVRMFPTPTWANDFEISAAEFGLDVDDRVAAGLWAEDLMGSGAFGWPNVFFRLPDALRFRDRFASGRDDVIVIGAGLLEEHVQQFLVPAGDDVIRRLQVPLGVSSFGVTTLVERRESLAGGGRALGYELLGMDVPPLTSWAVNDLPVLVYDRLGISVNEDGLIASFGEACRAAEFVSRPDVPSEPFSWTPWLIVEYA